MKKKKNEAICNRFCVLAHDMYVFCENLPLFFSYLSFQIIFRLQSYAYIFISNRCELVSSPIYTRIRSKFVLSLIMIFQLYRR